MANLPKKQSRDEARLAMALLQRKLVTEGQLKAALDYQRSLGVRLSDALVKLSIVKPQQIEDVSSRMEKEKVAADSPASEGPGEAPRPEGVVDPASVSVPDLKVHRRLLDKLPPELVEAGLVVTFFPPGMPQRRILVGHGRPLSDGVRRKIQAVVGVEICTVTLEPDQAVSILTASGRKLRAAPTGGATAPRQPAPLPHSSEDVVTRDRALEEDGAATSAPALPPAEEPLGRDLGLDELYEPAIARHEQPSFQRGAPPPLPRREEHLEAPSILDETIGSPPRQGANLGFEMGFSSAPTGAPVSSGEEPESEPEYEPLPGERIVPPVASPGAPPARARGAAPRPALAAGGGPILQALIGLLAKKGVITREELELEVELARIRQKAGSLITMVP